MSKEYIQALDDLFGLVAFQGSFERAQKYFNIIEEALERLDSIDTANPNEALECLEWLTSSLIGKYKLFYEEVIIDEKEYKESIECIKDDYNTIKQALLKAQENARSEEILQKYYQEGITLDSVRALKQERDNYKKILAIIKEKKVNILLLELAENVDEYNERIVPNGQLTQEEFNTLKEELENE